ncbi:MAG TPA: hypothetical protein VFN10_16620 [Thermoanaerobaculia bacterium]|nr:hypothetical protein [Thermoanaerobaculia bacterium]
MRGGHFFRNLDRPFLQILADDQVEEHLAHAVAAALGVDAADVRRLELDAGHRLQILAEHHRARAERHDQNRQQDDGENERHGGGGAEEGGDGLHDRKD